MKKTKVVFLGSRPLGKYALEMLIKNTEVEIVGCVLKKPSENAWWDSDPYELIDGSFPVYETYTELINIDFDLGVSINYWKIMPPELINIPDLGFINLHHSYNLSLRGRNMTAHAIKNSVNENIQFHGTCLHYTDDGLDTGPIIVSRACEIEKKDTGWSLFNKVEKLGREILEEWIPRILKNKIACAIPIKGNPLNSRIEDQDKFIKDIYDCPIKTYDTVRAFDFNGYFIGAQTLINGKKVELTVDGTRGHDILLKIDEERCVYDVKEEN